MKDIDVSVPYRGMGGFLPTGSKLGMITNDKFPAFREV